MDTRLIHRLDRFVGTPVCAALSAVERLRPHRGYREVMRPDKVLYIKLIEMGSTVLACPSFDAGEQLVGRDNVYLLCFERNRGIIDALPHVNPANVITIDDTSLGSFSLDLLRAMVRVRREGIDAAIDMEGLPRASAIITYLTGARQRVGYHNYTSEGPYRGRLFTHELGYTFQRHVSEMFLSLTRALSAPRDQQPMLKERIPAESLVLPGFEPGPGETEVVRALLREAAGLPPGDAPIAAQLVILNPNPRDMLPLRKWPEERYIELGRRLLADFDDLAVVISGNPGEAEPASRIARAIGPTPRALSMAGRTDLRQLLTLYTLGDLLVSSDSGPCHFAALTPISIVALFGPETEVIYAPLGDQVQAISSGLACSPCLSILNHRYSPCQDNRCMREITVDAVFEAASAALREGA